MARVGIITRLAASCAVALLTVCGGGAATAETPTPAAASIRQLHVVPAEFTLHGVRSRQRLIITGEFADHLTADLTPVATFSSSAPEVATVDAQGVVEPRGAGTATISIRHGQHTITSQVTVLDTSGPDPFDFRNEAIAALSRAGCSQGACHGSPQGKNGFRLSLRGFDPSLDFVTLTRESAGRRTNVVRPEESLLLLKGSAQVAHVGGQRFKPGESAFETLRGWIGEGAIDTPVTRQLVRLEVLPSERQLHPDFPRQRLAAMAHFDDGTIRDVSHLAVFSVNHDPAVEVTLDGEVQFQGTTEASVLVRYLEQVRSVRLTYVQHDPTFKFTAPKPANYVDEQIFARQRLLQLQPAAVSDDAVFLRRVFLDVIGTLPTADEARAFLDSKANDKRARLIDQLLERPEFAQFWALKWADVMRGSRETISERGLHSFHRYLVRHFAVDRSFAELARETLTGLGNTLHRPEASFFRVAQTPEEAAESMAQLFLGVRVQCARCHNHPFEALTQTDYYGLAAYFARVKTKGKQFMLDDAVIYLARSGEVQHPLTRKNLEPIAFGTPAGTLTPDDDRRVHLAEWLTAPENRYFAPSTVNRLWYHLLGTGIVEPVDDFRDTNPPSHPELLQALAADFVQGGYRIKPILRTILNSRTYQLSSTAPAEQSPRAARPDRYFVHAKVRMLSAEQILDGICSSTGIPESFAGYPAGTRAIELAEGQVDHHFLMAFSKPIRDVQCDCAREEEPSLNQVIHLLNNPSVVEKIGSPRGNLARWLTAELSTSEIAERLYLTTLSRLPTEAERRLVEEHVSRVGQREAALQDVQHALFNANEFLLRH